MEVNSVSFTGLAKTKKGNLYKKKNTGKKIGTVVGLGTAAAAYGTGIASLFSLSAASQIVNALKLKEIKLIPIHYGILGAGLLGLTLAGRLLGSIPDRIINHKRIKKADKNN